MTKIPSYVITCINILSIFFRTTKSFPKENGEDVNARDHIKSSVLIHFISNDRDVTCATYSINLALFAASDGYNTVRVWDFDTCFLDFQVKMETEISSMLLADNFPVLFIADAEGHIHVWSVRPAPQKNLFLCKYVEIESHVT